MAVSNFVVVHSDADRPAAANQDAQPPGARYGGIQQVALEHHVMSRDQRQDHNRKF